MRVTAESIASHPLGDLADVEHHTASLNDLPPPILDTIAKHLGESAPVLMRIDRRLAQSVRASPEQFPELFQRRATQDALLATILHLHPALMRPSDAAMFSAAGNVYTTFSPSTRYALLGRAMHVDVDEILPRGLSAKPAAERTDAMFRLASKIDFSKCSQPELALLIRGLIFSNLHKPIDIYKSGDFTVVKLLAKAQQFCRDAEISERIQEAISRTVDGSIGRYNIYYLSRDQDDFQFALKHCNAEQEHKIINNMALEACLTRFAEFSPAVQSTLLEWALRRCALPPREFEQNGRLCADVVGLMKPLLLALPNLQASLRHTIESTVTMRWKRDSDCLEAYDLYALSLELRDVPPGLPITLPPTLARLLPPNEPPQRPLTLTETLAAFDAAHGTRSI